MEAAPQYTNPEFDSFAENYDAALQEGLKFSGESKEYFAEARVRILQEIFHRREYRPQAVLDFGCGTGSATPWLLELDGVSKITGMDVSENSLRVARKLCSAPNVNFELADGQNGSRFDLAFCNGVFHHIPPPERPQAFRFIFSCLNPGGYFAFWENNPLNPGTRLIMNRIPFDKDAVMVGHREAKNMLERSGFLVEEIRFCFFFPRFLARFRSFEKHLTSFPLGAQYLVLAKKA